MKIVIALIGILFIFTIVSGSSLQRFIINKVTIDMKPNPYVGSTDVQINGEYNDTVTIKMPILKQLPENIILNNYLTYNDAELPPMKGDLCSLFDDKMFAPDVLAAGIPKDKFPKQCPVLPNEDYEIFKYHISPEKIPPGLPDGSIISRIFVSLDDNDDDYLLLIHAESALRTDLPGPSLMG